MKLFYSRGACSLAPHIVLHESGLAFEVVPANLKTHQLADGSDYFAVNPKGYVPLLELNSGERLTEGPAIVQYIADQVPDKQLAPPNGTMARYRLQEWLNFITSELHKGVGVLFNAELPEDGKAVMRKKATSRLTWVNEQLEGKSYLMGDAFTVADPYLFTVTNWTQGVGIDIAGMPHLVAFQARMKERPGVRAAMKAEGLMRA